MSSFSRQEHIDADRENPAAPCDGDRPAAHVSIGSQSRVALKVLLWRPMLRILLASNRRAGLILLYHDVADRDGDQRRELVPPISRARFARQLAHLKRYYRIV